MFSESQAAATFSNKELVQREVKAIVNQKARLSCNVSDTKTEVKWYKDGKLLESSSKMHLEAKGATHQLVVENIQESDAGEYTCEAGGDKLVFKIIVSGRNASSVSMNYGYIKDIPIRMFWLLKTGVCLSIRFQ